ncbi:MAG: hypothetical protein LBC87_01000 [Fibromonadaceae bacterium]|jgi:septum formation inhibitor MinC|nr:hypothetical protein [Fibromonadaceae bacterium]
MQGNKHYQLQIEKLKELITCLQNFETEVQNSFKNYQARLTDLIDQGLPLAVWQKFLKDYSKQSEKLVDKNTAVIDEQAIPYAAYNVKILEQLLKK